MTGTRNFTHTTFGGIINFSDFNTNYSGRTEKESLVARHIVEDWKFDNYCKFNIQNRERCNKYKKEGK